MSSCVLFNAKIGRILGSMVEFDEGVEPEFRRRRIEVDQGDAIAEDVVDPSDLAWLRRDVQSAFEKSLVKAVSRTKHESMDAGLNRILVPIGRGVLDREYRHLREIEG